MLNYIMSFTQQLFQYSWYSQAKILDYLKLEMYSNISNIVMLCKVLTLNLRFSNKWIFSSEFYYTLIWTSEQSKFIDTPGILVIFAQTMFFSSPTFIETEKALFLVSDKPPVRLGMHRHKTSRHKTYRTQDRGHKT